MPRSSRLAATVLLCSGALGCASTLDVKAARRGGDAVTQWTLIADYYGRGASNWRTLAIMQTAMHDALNAADPVDERWWPAEAGEPDAAGADAEVAMMAAAYEVLLLLHPDRADETRAAFGGVLRRYPDGPGKNAGERLGTAIGRAAVGRRARDGSENVRYFRGDEAPGRWRPTPPLLQTSRTNDSRPFLFSDASEVPTRPPPALGTPEYERQVALTRRLGGTKSTERTRSQAEDAYFWAYQNSQRGFTNLAVRLVAAHPPPGGVHGEARILAALSVALADSAILSWTAKERYAYWRPITAIRAEGDPEWTPLIDTPPFPEYPSGHASDCYVGSGVLEDAFPDLAGPIEYPSSAHLEPLSGEPEPPAPPESGGMGQHAQPVQRGADAPGGSSRTFPTFAALAENCADSRVWAGAHFAAAGAESKRIAVIIVHRAVSASAVRAPALSELRPPALEDGR
ncbi:MAG: hypothetical protein JOZ69_23990 [Myxococcales bacterium]|nr:hypothetical protein [Myxococcales bacterium]